jgi:2,3-dihydroxybiphenyl 1,2-dioxygenase
MIETLSYIGFSSPRYEDWLTFGPDVMGLEVAGQRGGDGAVRLRMDDAVYRIAVHPGDADDVAYLGWGVSGPRRLAAAIERLEKAGVRVMQEPGEVIAERAVADLVSFADPFGIRQELSWGQFFQPSTFRPGRPLAGFVTGPGGLGHAVLLSPDLAASEAFYVDILGFRMTDQIKGPQTPRLRFYNCNERHHTLALVEIPGVTGFHHLTLETASLDDVGQAYDLVTKGAAEPTMSLGRHTNDQMTSFYVRTPSAFEIEYGYGGIVLDPGEHLPRQYDRFSIWGHQPAGGQLAPPGIIKVLDAPAAPDA